jgi:hypothetical protein
MEESFTILSSDPKLEVTVSDVFIMVGISQGSKCGRSLSLEPNACFASCKMNLVQVSI